jgi:anti-anti-sigma regulatory factor
MTLEILLEMHKESQKKGGGIKIANPSEICVDIFYATHLANSLEIYSDIESARRSFL